MSKLKNWWQLDQFLSSKPSLATVVREISTDEVIEREETRSAHNYRPLPVAIDRGKGKCAEQALITFYATSFLVETSGVFVWDVEGKRYYDFVSGLTANNFGHCHPKIVETLREQANILHHTSRTFYNDIFGKYAEYVTEMFGYGKMIPMNTG